MNDAIVEETRRIRQQIEQEFGHDTNKYLQHVHAAQKQHANKLARRQPRRMTKRRAV